MWYANAIYDMAIVFKVFESRSSIVNVTVELVSISYNITDIVYTVTHPNLIHIF